jgi:hypothetical protein
MLRRYVPQVVIAGGQQDRRFNKLVPNRFERPIAKVSTFLGSYYVLSF